MIRRLAHLCLFTDNMEGMLAFYRDALGMKIKFTLDNEGGPFGYYVDCGEGTFIEIFDQKKAVAQWGGQVQQLGGDTRFRHLCLEVVGLEVLKEKLASSGVQVGDISTGMDGSRQAWTGDPDGNAIEFMEYTGHSRQLGA